MGISKLDMRRGGGEKKKTSFLCYLTKFALLHLRDLRKVATNKRANQNPTLRFGDAGVVGVFQMPFQHF